VTLTWTRREFLVRSALAGAAATTGCTTTVRGAPQADPAGRRENESTAAAEPDALTVGIVAFRPYTIEQGGEATGPVPDIARAVLEKMGHTGVQIVTFPDESGIWDGLDTGRFDVIGGLAVRKELCDRLAFSNPDIVAGTALIVPDGNPKGLRGYAEIVATNARVAVLSGLPERADALEAGVPKANVTEIPVPHQLVEAVRNGQVDCAAYDDITARDLATTLGDGEVSTAEAFMPAKRRPYLGAYAFPPESDHLLEPFNRALRELHLSGEWLSLVEPYGLTELNDPPAELAATTVCGG
jgi:polar amino acid transport system substrate-binding protein